VAEHQVDHEKPPQDALVPPYATAPVGKEAFFHIEHLLTSRLAG